MKFYIFIIAPEMIEEEGHSFATDWWSLGILIYYMIYGVPPFYSNNRDILYKNILTKQVWFPPNINCS